MTNRFSRKSFIQKTLLATGGALLAPSFFTSCKNYKKPVVRLLDHSNRGHRLRNGAFPPISEEIKINTLILGGGVSGLATAYGLSKKGKNDYRLLELHDHVGGNSLGGKNEVTSYPLGAHYLPIANNHNQALIDFLYEEKIITHFDERGLPHYKEEYLCADPDERLYLDGYWQKGLIPFATLNDEERSEIKAFLDQMEYYKTLKGSDNRYVFDIPISQCSADENYIHLDNISFFDWLQSKGWKTAPLHWFVDYSCRDDYGTSSKDTSAWAGIHYFSSRKAKASNAESDEILTWPEGNYFLVKKLSSFIPKENIQTGCIIYDVQETQEHVIVEYFDDIQQRSIRVIAQQVVYALPLFLLKYMKNDWAKNIYQKIEKQTYAPWMVANLYCNKMPMRELGAPLSWDNVIAYSDSLGYVNSNHQKLESRTKELVLTYYKAFADSDPQASRKKLHEAKADQLAEDLLYELQKVHPDIRDIVNEVEIQLWGHAMARPTVGELWGRRISRNKILNECRRVQFVHTDVSGISIFEEAFDNATRAVNHILNSKEV
jgi:hypothetical protein